MRQFGQPTDKLAALLFLEQMCQGSGLCAMDQEVIVSSKTEQFGKTDSLPVSSKMHLMDSDKLQSTLIYNIFMCCRC